MAGLFPAPTHPKPYHGLTSLVIHPTRPANVQTTTSIPPMDNNKDIIIISDDEDERPISDDEDGVEHFHYETHQDNFPAPPGPSRTRTNLELSPTARRENKRQKLLDGFRSFPVLPKPVKVEDQDAAPGPAYPRARLNFAQDEQGNTQAFPTFFDEAFYPEEITNLPSSDPPNANLAAARQKPEPGPPYIDDPTFKIRMFCGPGYEQFPVPVALNEEHKKICEKWDAKKQLRNERRRLQQTRDSRFGPYMDPFMEVEESDNDSQNDIISPVEEQCMQNVFEVLPDVDYEFVKGKVHSRYESYRFGDEDIEVIPDTEAIVAEILELDDYPRAKVTLQREKDPFEEETGRTIKWDKNHTAHFHYTLDTVKLLADQFDHVPTFYINKIMMEKRSLWDTYVHINDVDTNYFQQTVKPYRRAKNRRTMIEKKYDRGLDPRGDPNYYASLVNELQAAKQHVARNVLKQVQDQQASDAERANIEKHRAEGRLLECRCCFDDEVPLNRSVPCRAVCAHFFCYDCVRGLADSQIGLMKYEMLCMDSSRCNEKLDTDGIGKAIPVKTFDRLAFNQQQAEIAAAEIEGLEQCPFCDFKAICDPVEVNAIFACQNPDCFKVTCRKCHEAVHLPKTCEQSKKDRGLQARHTVEEARSDAMIRRCPKCKAKIIKEAGCNKMRCTCGTLLCYVCKLDLSSLRDGYEHFNKAGSKCPLYDTAGVDRHEQEADEAEKKAIQEAKVLDATIEESVLQIETGKQKVKSVRPSTVQPGLRVPPYPVPPLIPIVPAADPVARLDDLRGQIDQLREQMRNRRPRIGRLGRARNAAAPAPQPVVVPPPAVPNLFPDPGNNLGGGPRQLPVEQLNQNVHQWLHNTNPPLNYPPQVVNNQDIVEAQQRDNNLQNLTAADRIQNFRNDLVRRRRSQTQRQNTVGNNNSNGPPTLGFFNLKQPRPAQDGDIEMQVNKAVPAGTGFDAGVIQPTNQGRAQLWRDQYRPQTPVTIRDRPRDNINNGIAEFGRNWNTNGGNGYGPQLPRNQVGVTGLQDEKDGSRTLGPHQRPTLLQQRPLARVDQDQGDRPPAGLGMVDRAYGQPENHQQHFQPQPPNAQRWSMTATIGHTQPNAFEQANAFKQGLGLLDSQWAERPQAQVQIQPRQVAPPVYGSDLDFGNFGNFGLDYNPNDMFADLNWNDLDFGEGVLANPVSNDNVHGVPWPKLN